MGASFDLLVSPVRTLGGSIGLDVLFGRHGVDADAPPPFVLAAPRIGFVYHSSNEAFVAGSGGGRRTGLVRYELGLGAIPPRRPISPPAG